MIQRVIALGVLASVTPGMATPDEIRGFLDTHCVACHGAEKEKGGVRFDTLDGDFLDRGESEIWLNAMDQVNYGDMPPEDESQPSASEISSFADWVAKGLRDAETARLNAGDGTVVRRLNRKQYTNTIRDLLHLDYNTEIRFPLDDTRHGFDRVGGTLTISPTHLEKLAEAAKTIVDRAVVTTQKPQKPRKSRREGEIYIHADDKSKKRRLTGIYNMKSEGRGYPDIVTTETGVMIRSRGLRFLRFPGRGDGVYRVRIRGYGVPHGGLTPRMRLVHVPTDERTPVSDTIPIEATEDAPETYEFTLSLRGGRNGMVGVEIGNAWRLDGGGERRRRADGRLPEFYAPALFIDWVEIEGPIHETWPPRSTTAIFPKGIPAKRDAETARKILGDFARRAFRRPLRDGELDPILALAETELANGVSFVDAVKFGVQTILCSPSFLYLIEERSADGGVDDYAIASRLSYFLWDSMPDQELFDLAKAGALRDPAVREAQALRMLADPKAERFKHDFPTQWLALDKVGQFPPDPKIFPEYDEVLEQAMAAESYAFFREILENDLSVLEFLDSDWTFVNDRLARHYGIDGVSGAAMQRVSLSPESQRGGLLTQAGILGLTSDGTRHRPVHRGVWVLENLLASPPPPPPPNVPEIEPNVPGGEQLTVRQRLDLHRELKSCASCHAKLDPYGFALENFDAIGRFRTEENGRPVDASGTLGAGRQFENIVDFKTLLRNEENQFLHALAEKMFLYGLGREPGFTHRETLDSLVLTMKEDDYTLRSLITGLVKHPIFQTK